MSKHLSLVGVFLLASLSVSVAEQIPQPEMVKDRSVTVQPTPGADIDPSQRLWAEHAMSKFLDGEMPPSEPAE